MLKREQESQLVRLCEIVEQRNQMQDEIERRNNEIQNEFLEHEDLTDQLSNANEEIRILKAQNERTRNDLNIERQIIKIL